MQADVSHCLFPVWFTHYELQSDLYTVVTCAGRGGAWERLSSVMRQTATSTRFGAA